MNEIEILKLYGDRDNYFEETKLERDRMYSEMIETYQKLIDTQETPEDQKAIAAQEISNITKTKNGIIYGYIDYNGKVLIEPKYESISRALEYEKDDIYLIFMDNGKKGVIKNDKIVIKPRYQSINYYDATNIFIVNKNGKYGFFEADGNEILKTEYESYSVAGNYISVKKDDKSMLYDLHGNLVNTNTYKSILETGNSSYFIAQNEEGYYSIISKDVQIQDKYTHITYAFDNFFIFTNEDGLSGVLNVYTGIEIPAEYDPSRPGSGTVPPGAAARDHG